MGMAIQVFAIPQKKNVNKTSFPETKPSNRDCQASDNQQKISLELMKENEEEKQENFSP